MNSLFFVIAACLPAGRQVRNPYLRKIPDIHPSQFSLRSFILRSATENGTSAKNAATENGSGNDIESSLPYELLRIKSILQDFYLSAGGTRLRDYHHILS